MCLFAPHTFTLSYITDRILNHVSVFQIVVLLQRTRRSAWKDPENQRDEHEQPEEALQPGHGSSRTHVTRQEPVGTGPGQTHM